MQKLFFSLVLGLSLLSCRDPEAFLSGELRQWHTVTLSLNGPGADENGAVNPFLDYRLDAVFTHGSRSFRVPGFFAADGNASETGAVSGSCWKLRFTPPETGRWDYRISFRSGPGIAVNDSSGIPVAKIDGMAGSFVVGETDKKAPDFRAKGRLGFSAKRYLRFEGNGEFFLKAGADSPENFLAFADFDGTPPSHRYAPHLKDWKLGDPVWRGGKGKGIIGALNYLASKGMNSVYFIAMNVMGDGNDVWPWTRPEERLRFDVSKLEQWEIVFSHMERLGIMMHLLTQETENQLLLDIGNTSVQRKLYYRELVARFGHHLAVTWNLGEENGPANWIPLGQTDAMRREMAAYLKKINPYDPFIVIHTHSDAGNRDPVIRPLLGNRNIQGLSLQEASPENVYRVTAEWIEASRKAGAPWVVSLDEIGHYTTGVVPDSCDPSHDPVRMNALWPHLLAGGAGVEWYFGGDYPHNDLNCEDWRSRDAMWDQTRYAAELFRGYLPFWNMEPRNDLMSGSPGFCLAAPGEAYVLYLKSVVSPAVDLGPRASSYSVFWLNPRDDGGLKKGSVESLSGKGMQKIGMPAGDTDMDWVALIRRYPKQ
jgi:hypothetical protein